MRFALRKKIIPLLLTIGLGLSGCVTQEQIRAELESEKGDEKLIPFLTHGDSQDPEVKDIPRLSDVIKGEANRAVLNAWLAQYDFQRPLTLPPGTPKARLNILRKAFKATLKDPTFLAQAKKSKLIINYVSGEEIDRLVDQILAISPEAKERLQFLIHKKKKKTS